MIQAGGCPRIFPIRRIGARIRGKPTAEASSNGLMLAAPQV